MDLTNLADRLTYVQKYDSNRVLGGFFMNKTKKVFAIAVLVFAIALFAQSAPALEPGAKVPNFTLLNMQDEKVSLQDFKGQIVILNFWATWCPPCRQEMPEFNKMDAELRKSGEAVLLTINLTDGQRETKAKVSQFMASNKYGFRVLLDSEGKAASIFNIRGIPTTVIIDRNGALYEQIVGATTKDRVMAIVKSIK